MAAVDEGLPVDCEAAFARAMAALGPFEPAPAVAVAVSGGSDSLALALLAAGWVRSAGGRLSALTVDHGLRPESRPEARQVGRWLRARGIEHRILTWSGPRPRAGLQAAARAARYRLLTDWCRSRGILHLLLGHQMEDQAETFLIRLQRGSGADGLAGMASVTLRNGVRLLRPLLSQPREALRAVLRRSGQPWLEDPSNANPAFGRTAARRLLGALEAGGLPASRLGEAAARIGRARAALESATSRLMAEAVALHPAGFCRVAVEPVLAAPEDLQLRLLNRALMCIGGLDYPPRREHVLRLRAAIAAGALGRGRTLAGCAVRPCEGGFLVLREAAALPADVGLQPGAAVRWDRFQVRLEGPARPDARARLRVGALGEAGWRLVKARLADDAALALIPRAARPGLPALWRRDRPVAVPHLGYRAAGDSDVSAGFRAVFRPPHGLAPAGFRVV